MPSHSREIKTVSLRITELDIEALIDAQLTPEKEHEVRAAMNTHPDLRDYHDKVLAQKKLLAAWWKSSGEYSDD